MSNAKPAAPLSHSDIFLAPARVPGRAPARLTASDACERLARACQGMRDAYAPILKHAPKQPTLGLRIDDVL